MTNTFVTSEGVKTVTYQEKLESIQNSLKSIFNDNDLDFSSNSPWGQFTQIQAQLFIDMQTQLVEVYNIIKSIDNSNGVNLDYLGAGDNVYRKTGTYTQQEVEIMATTLVPLQGLDGNINNSAFTISNGNGVNFALVNSAFTQVGINTLLFQATEFGEIEALPNTLTNIVTVQLGITGANNPQPPLSVGTLEETDGAYKIRQRQSSAINASGYIKAIYARLFAIPNVTNALILENSTPVTDANGLISHSIKVIVEGGSDEEVAIAIDRTKPCGTGMNGDVIVPVIQPAGQVNNIKFERAETISIYIKFDIQNNTTNPIDLNFLKETYASNITFELNETANSGNLTCTLVDTLKQLGLNAFAFNLQISSNNINFTNILPTPDFKNKWGASATNINITLI